MFQYLLYIGDWYYTIREKEISGLVSTLHWWLH